MVLYISSHVFFHAHPDVGNSYCWLVSLELVHRVHVVEFSGFEIIFRRVK